MLRPSRRLSTCRCWQDSSVTINRGTLWVAELYINSLWATGPTNSRITIHRDGRLNVDELILNAGVMDIAGGTVVVRADVTDAVAA
jgi:hypothetical protein